MRASFWLSLLTLIVLGWPRILPASATHTDMPPGDDGCIACHASKTTGFSASHAFAGVSCSVCHRGDPLTRNQVDAHRDLIAFPGNLDNAQSVCAPCHANQVDAVTKGFMHLGHGIVALTRKAFGEATIAGSRNRIDQLGLSPADSLLRKLCAGCHLGHAKTAYRREHRRHGGGCLACHIASYPASSHPRLTAKVADERCFGCHSRSGRASLNYQGLAEVEASAWQQQGAASLQRLDDGRLVEGVAPDVHYVAGMGCTDCHTGNGLMASAEGLDHAQQAVDIQCRDCHLNEGPRISLQDWPAEYVWYRQRIPFAVGQEQRFLVTQRNGTPLWNIEVDGEPLYLYTKADGVKLEIPAYQRESHEPTDVHQRVTCSACHSQWAPQCYGCHIRYIPDKRQWDHQEGRATPGRWQEERWMIRNGPPTLGVRYDGRIGPFVPGMIFSLEVPEQGSVVFRRIFAAIEPHTSGAARTCVDCHRSTLALGLGQGSLHDTDGHWRFKPDFPALQDGLAADAWTSLSGAPRGSALREGARPLSSDKIKRLWRAFAEEND